MAAVADIWYTKSPFALHGKNSIINIFNQIYHAVLTNQTNLCFQIKLSWEGIEEEMMVNLMMELLKLYSHS